MVTETQSEQVTEAQTAGATEAQTEQVTEAQTAGAAEAQTEQITEAQTAGATEAQSEGLTIETEVVTEVRSSLRQQQKPGVDRQKHPKRSLRLIWMQASL
ncbi:MAG: hypothetical protein ACLTSZ_13310 [Lachnospiraceae bacterium]